MCDVLRGTFCKVLCVLCEPKHSPLPSPRWTRTSCTGRSIVTPGRTSSRSSRQSSTASQGLKTIQLPCRTNPGPRTKQYPCTANHWAMRTIQPPCRPVPNHRRRQTPASTPGPLASTTSTTTTRARGNTQTLLTQVKSTFLLIPFGQTLVTILVVSTTMQRFDSLWDFSSQMRKSDHASSTVPFRCVMVNGIESLRPFLI